MAVKVALVAVGIVVGVIGGAAAGIHAADPDPSQQVKHAAEVAGVDAVELQGALNSVGQKDPYTYLYSVGELEHPPALALAATPKPRPTSTAPSSALAECIIRAESRGNPDAVNARSGASGLGQFLRSTWLTTPQGKAGLSVFDPAANRAAVNYMISAGRAREFSTLGLCR